MSDRMSFLVFGDQSVDTHDFLADFYRRGNPGLSSAAFLKGAGTALSNEIMKLPSYQRQSIPPFSTIRDLNERYYVSTHKCSGIDSALLCITQLANYIDRAEKSHEDVRRPWEANLVGFCTGIFAATAVASAHSLSALVPLGIQMVLFAFRTGAYVAAMADRLHQSKTGTESWTYILPGADERKTASKLADFHKTLGIPPAAQAYISAVAANNIAVSGPPPTLRTLFSSEFTPGTKQTAIPVFGPYHASHLHSKTDIEKVLRLDDFETYQIPEASVPQYPIISSTTGSQYEDTNFRSLLVSVVHDILNEPLRFDRALDGCISKAQNYKGTKCLVIPFGPTYVASTLATKLKAQTDHEIILGQSPSLLGSAALGGIGNHGSSGRCKLAIVGMAGRFPDAATHEKLWELLEKGVDAHRVVPRDRFPVETHVDPTGKACNTSHTPYGCWIENPGLFDPRFFNMSPREAFQTDPMQRMAISTAYEALEMSGYIPNRTRSTKLDRIGTFYGQTSDDWREINIAQDVDTYFITGGVRAFGPGRINYHFGFSGPSFNIDTACSSSFAALQLACTSLYAEDCDTAIVGGLSCMTNSDIFAGLSRGQFLSKTGPCATFDNDADGYCRADGVGTVIIKRLEDAKADKDNILAVILGTQTNHSADAISITHPHGGTQEILYRSILNNAGIDPLDVDYVEMHGTGTQAGDGTEMKSVTNVFAPADRKRSVAQPLYLGSVKANVGHGEAASGITALIKTLMMLHKSAIPPHVGIKNTINKTFPKDLAERNVNIAFKKTPLLRKSDGPRRVFVNNFSAAGGNTGLLLEDGPVPKLTVPDPRSTHVVAITAKSKSAMLKNAERLIAYLQEHPETSISDLSYTTTARRIQYNWRMSVTATDINQVRASLLSKINDNFTPVLPEPPKVAFLFTGQGSHYAALGKELYQSCSTFRDNITEFSKIAEVQGFPSFLPLIDGSVTDLESFSPVVTQLGLVCFEMAMALLWQAWGIKPSAVLGHSLGEYAALNVAGVLSASDVIFLVGSRAQLLVERCSIGSHAMLAIQGPVSPVTEALGDDVRGLDIACINGPRETVLSGETAKISAAAERLVAASFRCTQLKVPFAFHSAQVDPILESFEELAKNSVQFNAPRIPIISPLLGRMLGNGDQVDATYLRKHAREAVNFMGGLISAQVSSVIDEKTVWLEVGPHPVCLNMVKAAFGTATIAAPTLRRSESAWKTSTSSLCVLHGAGLNIDWNEYHRDMLHCVRLLDLPTYSFDDKNYWIQYEGDWCLTKGRLPQKSLALLEDAKPKLSTTTVHKVIQESVKGDVATVVIETDLARSDLRGVVTGHVVNGAFLCPSSLYADMAMTVCDYAYKLLRPDIKDIGMNVEHMEVTKTLIGDPAGKTQIIQLSVAANAKLGHADLVFSSGDGKSRTEHAQGRVYFGDNKAWLREWERTAYLIQSRIDCLKSAEKEGKAYKIGRGLAYKLFAALVDYNPRYRGMEEVILLSNDMEATAKVNFQTTPEDGTFFCSPYWIDSACHISGFIVNGSDAVDSINQVYISHGWESLRFAEPLCASKTYQSYVKMQPNGKMMVGDVYVFDQDRIVGMVGGLKFQCIPRKILNTFIPPAGASAPAKAPAKPLVGVSKARNSKSRTKTVKTAQVSMTNISSVNKKLTSVSSQVFDILAHEIGVGLEELVDNIVFAELGVDSLMSLTVSGRIREEMEMEIHSSSFVDYPTIGEFRKFLAGLEKESAAIEATSKLVFEDPSPESTPELDGSEVSTPLDDSSAFSEISARDSSLSEIIKATIAIEMGVELDEVSTAPDLSLLGMDSLMSLSILGSLREKTGLDFPSDLFVTSTSLKAIEQTLNIGPSIPSTPAKSTAVRQVTPASASPRTATSVLLQGNPRKAKKQLWMVPDGGGSATSYVDIPDISPDVAVWGLNSPFMKTPEEFTIGVTGMAQKFIVEMKRRQPKGPYMLAGWSAGGVIAFEASNQLIKNGDEVELLILIDAPCPLIIEPLPSSLHRWFASIGLLGDGDASKIPPWLLPHFAASVQALSTYTAEKIRLPPPVLAIWCEDGVCKYPSDPRPDPYPYGHAQWLLENRADFGPNLWDAFLGTEKIVTKHMPGNHFSMMKGSNVKILGELIKKAVTKS